MSRIAFAALSLLALHTVPASAQSTDTTSVVQQAELRPTVPRPKIFERRDAWIAAGFSLGAIALFPFDQQIAGQLQSPAAQSNRSLDKTALTLEKITSPGAYLIGGGMYLAGRLGGSPRLADLALHTTESVVLAEGIGYVLKRTIGRARPYMSDATDPRDFGFGTGFATSDRRSLPSGHTYTAFAVASAVTSEMSAWSPRTRWIVAPVMYGGATMVGLSRMYHNQHWASDIALGAAIGTFSGLKVVRFMHRNDAPAGGLLSAGAPIVRRNQDATQLGWRFEF
jgi:hypothetical protein